MTTATYARHILRRCLHDPSIRTTEASILLALAMEPGQTPSQLLTSASLPRLAVPPQKTLSALTAGGYLLRNRPRTHTPGGTAYTYRLSPKGEKWVASLLDPTRPRHHNQHKAPETNPR